MFFDGGMGGLVAPDTQRQSGGSLGEGLGAWLFVGAASRGRRWGRG